jgi:uncharacterized protein YdhG (YjbR/CyaY superfamily)
MCASVVFVPKSKQVEAWLARYENPMKDVVLRIRDIIHAADQRIAETIKWQAPTFTFQGNLASFFPKAKQHASLMFHEGAKIPGRHPRLEGAGATSRVLKLGSVADAKAAAADITRIVRAWIDWRLGGAGPTERPVRAAKPRKAVPAKTGKKAVPAKTAPSKAKSRTKAKAAGRAKAEASGRKGATRKAPKSARVRARARSSPARR